MSEDKIVLNNGTYMINIPHSTPDNNGRIYPREVMEKAIKEYQHKINIEQRNKKIKKICSKLGI